MDSKSKVDALINVALFNAQSFSDDEVAEFAEKLNVLTAAMLRGIHGDKYVTDFLTAALNDKNKLTMKRFKLH